MASVTLCLGKATCSVLLPIQSMSQALYISIILSRYLEGFDILSIHSSPFSPAPTSSSRTTSAALIIKGLKTTPTTKNPPKPPPTTSTQKEPIPLPTQRPLPPHSQRDRHVRHALNPQHAASARLARATIFVLHTPPRILQHAQHRRPSPNTESAPSALRHGYSAIPITRRRRRQETP